MELPLRKGTLVIFQRMLETVDTGDVGFIESLAEYTWVFDGITDTEGDLLDSFRHMLETDVVKSSLLVERKSRPARNAGGLPLGVRRRYYRRNEYSERIYCVNAD